MSKGEQNVVKVLKSLKVEYRTEVMFDGLTNELGVSLPIDFVIKVDDKLAMIEFNGQQHYQDLGDDIADFNNGVRNDVTRVNYAMKTGIPLLVIHFSDLSKIESIIKQFIGHIKGNCRRKQQYSDDTFGHFAQELVASAPKLTDVFVSTVATNESFQPVVDNDQFKLSQNQEFGFVQIDPDKSGAIIWTVEQMNKFTTSLKREQKLANSAIVENQNLIAKLALSSEHLLELTRHNTQLEVQISKLEEACYQLETEVLALKQQLEQQKNLLTAVELVSGRVIKVAIPFPEKVRKANRQFTSEFKEYINKIQLEHQLSLDELREYLNHFGLATSDAILQKMVA